MDPPFMGEHQVRLSDLRPLEIHGSRYVDVAYCLADDPTRTEHVCRMGPEAIDGQPQKGDMCLAQFVMRQMTRLSAISTEKR